MGALAVHVADVCVVRSRDRSGELVVRVGVPLADVYLEFLGGRCRPTIARAKLAGRATSFCPRGSRQSQGTCRECASRFRQHTVSVVMAGAREPLAVGER
jgi:hypothetical protein